MNKDKRQMLTAEFLFANELIIFL